MAQTATELTWLTYLLDALHIPKDLPVLHCDNLSALALASNPVYHARTKHIELDYHYIREQVMAKNLTISYVPTIEQLADIFTKSLTGQQFQYITDKLPLVAFQQSA